MKVVIDTNSLLSLVRYYLPFDIKSVLFDFFKIKLEQGEIIIIDKVLDQCKYISKGIVLKNLSYLTDKKFLKSSKLPYITETLIAPSPAKFLRQVDNQFVNQIMKNKIDEVEYETLKTQYLEDADMKLIILCLNLLKNSKNEEIILVTEETEASNDNKLFKKVPAICKVLNVKTITLPELLGLYREINFEFNNL